VQQGGVVRARVGDGERDALARETPDVTRWWALAYLTPEELRVLQPLCVLQGDGPVGSRRKWVGEYSRREALPARLTAPQPQVPF
jgi:hypothetical protein